MTQDPTDLARHNMSQFDHVKKDIKLMSDADRAALEVVLLKPCAQNPKPSFLT